MKLILGQSLRHGNRVARRHLGGDWQFWFWPVFAGITVGVIWMLSAHPEPFADYAFCFTQAVETSQGLGNHSQGDPTAFFPAGTSLLLAGPFTENHQQAGL
jgi:hypothetical protein